MGSVPATKSSRTGDGQSGPGSSPVGAQTVASTMPAGRAYQLIRRPSAAAIIASRQIGPAPSTPATSCMGEPSALPTHTPIVTSGVKPSVQVSREPEPVALDLRERGEPEAVRDLQHRVDAEGVERAHRGDVE